MDTKRKEYVRNRSKTTVLIESKHFIQFSETYTSINEKKIFDTKSYPQLKKTFRLFRTNILTVV